MEVLNNKQPNLTATTAQACPTNDDNLNTSNSVSRQNGQIHFYPNNYDSGMSWEDESDDEEQSLESWLNPVEPDKDYKKVPVELLETINRICQERSIQYPAVIQAADNYRHILVTGQKVECIQPLLAAVANKFAAFEVFTQNRNGPLLAKQMVREDAVVVEQMFPSPTTSAELLHGREWRSHNTALCDLFVANNRSQVYAVAPGHMNLSAAERRQAAGFSQDVRKWREKVEAITTTKRFVIKTLQGRTDLSHPPLHHYRHWYIDQSTPGKFCPQNRCNLQNSNQLCPHMCMNDIALLRIDVTEAKKISDENENLRYDCRLVQIDRKDMLEQLTNRQPIRVRNMEGYTTSPTFTNGPQHEKYGFHFAFVLSSYDCSEALHRLETGDCGSIVSLLHPDGRCRPMGMFVGEYQSSAEFSSKPIYQAIILDQALKDIEIDYPHHVEHLTSFRPEEGARPPSIR